MKSALLENIPAAAKPCHEKGQQALEHRNFDYAMDMFEAVLQIEPRLLEVRRLLKTAAVKKAKAAPPKKSDIIKAELGLVKASLQLKKNPAAIIETAEQLLRLDPFNHKFAKLQCSAAEAADCLEIAIMTMEVLNKHTPRNLTVLERLAGLYNKTGQIEQELGCRRIIAELRPGDTKAAKALKDTEALSTIDRAGWDKAESFRDVTD